MSSDRKESCGDPGIYFLGGYHPVNESFIRSPPSGFQVSSRVSARTFDDFNKPHSGGRLWKPGKYAADTLFAALGIPRLVPVVGRYDLIHTNGGIVPASFSPWVASVENPSSFYGFREVWHEKRFLKARLAKILLSDRCRAILPYSEASREYLTMALDEWSEHLDNKIRILPPAIDRYLIIDSRRFDEKLQMESPTRFLFVGNHFFDKGGREVLRAFRTVREQVECELCIITSAPPHHEQHFSRIMSTLKNEKGVRFFATGIGREQLLNIFRSSDCFVFPSYMDQVPFVLLEAMASGLAMIGSNSFAIPEMVLDGRNGFTVKSPWLAFPRDRLRTNQHLKEYRSAVLQERNFDSVVDQLIERMSQIAGDTQLRSRLARASLELVSDGVFSTKSRNAILSETYDSAIAGGS